MTDDIAERARKIGGTTLHSIGDIARHQRLKDNDEEFVSPEEMLAELSRDNQQLTQSLRAAHEVCEEHNDVATASMIENWIDETEPHLVPGGDRARSATEITRKKPGASAKRRPNYRSSVRNGEAGRPDWL